MNLTHLRRLVIIAVENTMETMSDQSCVFCSIAAKDTPAEFVYQDDNVVAIKDANPQAPVHILLIPRVHDLESLNDASKLDVSMLGHLLYTAAKVANLLDIAETGYRVVINTGDVAGQSVAHLHVHVLGGRKLAWPPG
jgi:histidine triad (HIT) family protein